MRTVRVVRFTDTDDVAWSGGDGKPRCRTHRGTCLVRAAIVDRSAHYEPDEYVCAACLRAAA